MFEYCLRELHLSEGATYKRIRAARVARKYPAILDALATGRLHLSAVVLLKPCLSPDNIGELVTAATHKTKAEIEQILAQRFPKADVPERIKAITLRPSVIPATVQLSPGTVASSAAPPVPGPVEASVPRPVVVPLAPERYAIQFTIGKSTHDKLRYAQELLSHQLPSGDVAQVFERALDELVKHLEKQKFAATEKPQRRSRPSANPRYIPAHVKRAVWKRDQGQCTFVSENGQRCESRKQLEYDHIEPVALGGQVTVAGVRLRCRGHNQYEAECTFGAGFMHEKREEARQRTQSRKSPVSPKPTPGVHRPSDKAATIRSAARSLSP